MRNTLAQAPDNIFGTINPPPGVILFQGGQLGGVPIFMNNIIRLIIIIAGLYAFFNILLAGYAFLSAGDDPKKIQGAWAKIYQSIIGLAVTAGSFVLAAIFGKLLFNDYTALLRFRIFGVQ